MLFHEGPALHDRLPLGEILRQAEGVGPQVLSRPHPCWQVASLSQHYSPSLACFLTCNYRVIVGAPGGRKEVSCPVSSLLPPPPPPLPNVAEKPSDRPSTAFLSVWRPATCEGPLSSGRIRSQKGSEGLLGVPAPIPACPLQPAMHIVF